MHCIFCALPAERVIGQNELAVWIRDGFPVSDGHSLILPRRHIGSFFDATSEERAAMMALLDEARAAVQEAFSPDGFNIGVNDGQAAGQTVPHLHIHLIPRRSGDVPDPRGGVRWVISPRAAYWSENKS